MFLRFNLMGFCIVLVGSMINIGVTNFTHNQRNGIFICGCFLLFVDTIIRLLNYNNEGVKALIKADCGGTCMFLPVWLFGLLSAIIAIMSPLL